MGSKKSGKPKKTLKAPKPKKHKFSPVLKIFIGAAIVVTGGSLFFNQSGMGTDLKPETSKRKSHDR